MLDANRDGLVREIRDLRPVLSRVADAGNDAVDGLDYLGTVIYPVKQVPNYFRGDYMNVFLDLDLRARTTRRNLLEPGDFATGGPASATVRTTAQLVAPAGSVR